VKTGTDFYKQYERRQEEQDKRAVETYFRTVNLITDPSHLQKLSGRSYVVWIRESWQYQWVPIAYSTNKSRLCTWADSQVEKGNINEFTLVEMKSYRAKHSIIYERQEVCLT
jgi:hypothetical protein